jgi:catalase
MAESNGKTTPDVLTNDFGAPVADNQHSLSTGNPGALPITRERVPEGVVHAKGASVGHVTKADADLAARVARGVGRSAGAGLESALAGRD